MQKAKKSQKGKKIMKVQKKQVIPMLFLLSGKTLFACCGCALVIASMNILKSSTKSTVSEINLTLGSYFRQEVVSQNKRYLKALESMPHTINDSIKLNIGAMKEYHKINFVIQKKNLVNFTKED